MDANFEASVSTRRLSDFPDWIYLLREYYEVYRFLSSGGSDKIRSHQRAVREAISRVQKANAPLRFDAPAHKPVTAHLKRALDEGRLERTATLIRAIESVQDQLIWQYGYEKVPKGLERNYAYAELCGPNGPVLTDEVILGLVLFAPNCTYPAHAHAGIYESYVCLSGAVSENHQGVYAPGSMIYNPPEHTHRITVSKTEPALLAYAWIGPNELLANQKMVFSRKRSK
ncbi:dimethylsulfoniopropionate lyase DddL [Roseibium hamelinense]|uniref:Dimethylsulfoniopropionate lyase DddL n=1 Tax=Roseibium hamelinense TaxID=150831 RepID=A0A562T8Z9_9HYPH|nr:dimethylsulfonioproprionate lyase family protein [Roseibium hamelinense]MTI45552.1 dimethlysulfonioproprionate lyase DddL [Roseibium hamelinense]TWI90071.1 dimethylsulfoniopropionate lyase DddL [Roseibium hamelinense]